MDAIEVYRRSRIRQRVEAIGVGFGAVIFLGMAALMFSGAFVDALEVRILGALGFGFFGVLMAVGAVTAVGRGTDSRVAEIGPNGVWLPELEFLAWSGLAEVRLERMRGLAGGNMPSTRQFRRLGFVPKDPSIRPIASTAIGWDMARGYVAFVKRFAPQIRLGGDEAAPFGVSEIEVPNDFDRLIEAVRRYVPVLDAAEARARRVAGRWTIPNPSATAARPDLGALDAALGQASSPTAAQANRLLVDPSTVAVPEPRGAFGVPAIKPLEVLFAVLSVAAPVFVVPTVLPSILSGSGASPGFGLLVVGIVVAAFVGRGVIQLLKLARRARERSTDAARLRVGPDGIWTRTSGLIPWERVSEIRTEQAGWERHIGTPPIERWRIVVALTDGGRHGVNSDEIDADFDSVLDLVRFYRPVLETA